MALDQTLENVADRLRRNEDGYSCLQLQMNPGFEARDINLLAEAILANNTLKEVEFFGILAEDDVNYAARRLFESFGSLPSLRSLKISGYCEQMVQALGLVLERTHKLETLSISYVQLDGFPSDFTLLNKKLQSLRNVKKFHLVNCRLPEWLQRGNVLDIMLQSISQLPQMKEIMLAPIEPTSLGSPLPETTSQICTIQSLEKLHIFGFHVMDSCPHLEPMIRALVETNNLAIRDLRLTSSLSHDHCSALANLIRTTTTLECLTLDIIGQIYQNDKHIIMLAEALQANTSLKQLVFKCSDSKNFAAKTLEEFGNLLESNFSLQMIHFESADGEIREVPIISMYMKLNQRGRDELFQNDRAMREIWVEKILSFRDEDDLDCIYYLVSINPSLCESTIC